jgi:hypothetical protein
MPEPVPEPYLLAGGRGDVGLGIVGDGAISVAVGATVAVIFSGFIFFVL